MELECMHEMHSQIQGLATILLAHDPLSSLMSHNEASAILVYKNLSPEYGILLITVAMINKFSRTSGATVNGGNGKWKRKAETGSGRHCKSINLVLDCSKGLEIN